MPLRARACLLFCLTLATPVFAQTDDSAPPPGTVPAPEPPKPAPEPEGEAPSADDAQPPVKRHRAKRAPPAATSESPSEPEPTLAPARSPSVPDLTLGKEQAMRTARSFFTALLEADARRAMNDASVPFQLEERRIQSGGELFQEFLKDLRKKRTDLLTLYGIELLTPAEMEKKYGKPPARLAQFPYHDGKTFLAVANLSGHAAVALLKQTEHGFKVVGYHD